MLLERLHGSPVLNIFNHEFTKCEFVCLSNILFGYNFRKNRTMARKFWYVSELHRSALDMKNCCCVVHRSFYRTFQIFQYINIFCSFLIIQTGTKIWYVFKLYRSDLHTKISHRIQYELFYRALQEFQYVYYSFLITQIDMIFRFIFKLHSSDLLTKISHRIQHISFYKALQKFEYVNI